MLIFKVLPLSSSLPQNELITCLEDQVPALHRVGDLVPASFVTHSPLVTVAQAHNCSPASQQQSSAYASSA